MISDSRVRAPVHFAAFGKKALPLVALLLALIGFHFPPTAEAATVAGVTPGALSVNESGAAVYTIPIEVPPGTAGMQPSLSVAYNSRSGNGLLGVGWS